MKKSLLFISTLFAAGTLVANATTTLTFEIPECDRATQKKPTSRIDQLSLEAMGSFIMGLDAGNYGGAQNNANIDNWSTNADGKVVKDSAGTYTISLLSRVNGGGEWFTSVFDSTSIVVPAGEYVSALTLDLTASSDKYVQVILFVEYTDSENNTSIVASDAKTTINAGASGSVFLALTETEKTISKAAFVLLGQAGSDGTTAYNVTNVAFSATLSEIPEPSMFGLLAGTLALALAGTRRRRSKK